MEHATNKHETTATTSTTTTSTATSKSNRRQSNSTTPSYTRPSQPKSTLRLFLTSLVLFLLALASLATALPTNSTLIPIGGGVPLDVGQKVRLSKLNWGLGITLILFGLIEVFYGFKFIRLSLVVTGFLSWAIVAMIIMVAIRWDLVFTTFSVKFYYFWVWLIAGITGAILSFRYWDLGVTFSGAFGGFAVAMGIIAIANITIGNAGRYVLLAVLVLGGAAFATFFERVFIIMSTSFGGAYVVMFGVDQFVQVGYREMIVIFDFTGKTLTYHPSRDVYLMIGFSVVLAALGIFWEFWHHSTPILIDRKAVFRIYGRPFGKRPRKLVGQKIHHHLKTTSDVYAHIMGCFCFQRWTIDDVLFDEHIPDNGVDHIVPIAPSIPTGVPCPTCAVHPEPIPVKPSQPSTVPKSSQLSSPESKPNIPTKEGRDMPVKSAPMYSRPGSPLGAVVVTETYTEITDTNTESTILERQNQSRPQPSSDEGTHTSSTATTTTATTTTTSSNRTHIQHSETSSNQSETHHSTTSSPSSSSPIPPTSAIPRPPIRLEPQHPLFTQNLGEHTMEMLRLVTDDTSPDNTLPPIFPLNPHHRVAAQTVWRTAALPPPSSSTAPISMDRHVFDLLENIETSHRSDPSEDSIPEDEDVKGEEFEESEKPRASSHHWPRPHASDK
ncbi:hypothetical protein BG015_002322 [Linnemannia schmuckeri]|uniref:Transmembrane protein 198 n=1 Tax=Linnemannia schmuckeri TaxID=64567 RepID=A0A9P5V6E6_9FUNG|nr:hypothetical protein BG015_002322 [Linnemannia schmuckeri]